MHSQRSNAQPRSVVAMVTICCWRVAVSGRRGRRRHRHAAPADPLIAGFSRSTVASVADAVDQVVGRRGYLAHDLRPYVAGASSGAP